MTNPFCALSKDYTKKGRGITAKTRVPFMQREKTAIIKLRQHGWTIPAIRSLTGRSSSVIFNTLKKSFYTPKDLRKMPSAIRLQIAKIQRENITFQINRWLPFIEGSEDKPP